MTLRLPLALTCLLMPGSAVAQEQSEPLPDSLTGVHVLGECNDPDLAMLLGNPLSLVFEMSGDSLRMVAAPVRETEDGLEVFVTEDVVAPLPDSGQLKRCTDMPMEAKLPHGEAIVLIEGLTAAWPGCSAGPSRDCLSIIIERIDVSGDLLVSEAELTRVARGAASLLGGTLREDDIPGGTEVRLDDLFPPAMDLGRSLLAAYTVAPYISAHIIRSFDYDADGLLSLAEIAQDRDSFAATASEGLALLSGEEAADRIQGLSSFASGMLSYLPGGLGGTPPADIGEEPAASDLLQKDGMMSDAIGDALENAQNGEGATGAPLTSGERHAATTAIMGCWNVGALSSEALATSVVVSLEFTRDGTPDTSSIELEGYQGGSEAAARQAFEAARRAIIRCGTAGIPLPPKKYDQWKEFEMTFNPENMRIR